MISTKHCKLTTLLFLLAIKTSVIAQNNYVLQFHDDKVTIEASFESCGPQLYMIKGSASNSANGQLALIKEVSLIDNENRKIPLKEVDTGTWQVPDLKEEARKPVKIQYEVLLDFDRFNWNSGKEEMAYAVDKGYVFSMRSLFIWPLEKYDIDEAVDLSFHLPKGYQLISPWNLDDLKATQVRVPDFKEFLFNAFLVGDFSVNEIAVDDLHFTVACLDTLHEYLPLFSDVIRKNAQYYNEMIGHKRSNYLVIYGPGNINDGGAFENSFSQTIKGSINDTSLPVWGGLSAHELSHLWNGRGITYTGEEEEWVLEGWADYLTILALSQTNTISQEQVLDKLENAVRKYLISKYLISPNISLKDAGLDKQKNRMLIYGGGSMAALYLDIQIRQHSDNEYDLFTILKYWYSKHKERSFSNADLLKRYQTVNRIQC